jgi:hypothetical protein
MNLAGDLSQDLDDAVLDLRGASVSARTRPRLVLEFNGTHNGVPDFHYGSNTPAVFSLLGN